MQRSAADSVTGCPPDDGATPAGEHCQARLTLGFSADGAATRMTERAHYGPLRVQKPLYPEGPAVCHAIVVHPPGGVVGGDQLAVRAKLGVAAAACITTPGAAKWYKANGRISRQQVQLEVADHAALEWLPQETIFFDQAQVQFDHTVALGADATYIGCEILCFGRTASGESFDSGRIAQRTVIRRAGKLIWFEQGALAGGGPALRSPLALDGKTVCATFIAAGKTVPAALLGALREELAAHGRGRGAVGATQLKSVFVLRYLGDSSETAKQLMLRAWQTLRPPLLGREAVVPRIWNT